MDNTFAIKDFNVQCDGLTVIDGTYYGTPVTVTIVGNNVTVYSENGFAYGSAIPCERESITAIIHRIVRG